MSWDAVNFSYFKVSQRIPWLIFPGTGSDHKSKMSFKPRSKGFGHASEGDSSSSDHRPKRRKFEHKAAMSTGPPDTSTPMKSKFGAKMMAKMGYVEGQGLGAQGRGRLAPIETQLRPQGIGLGAVKEKTKQAKEEEKREAAFRGEVIEDSEEEAKQRRIRSKKDRLAGVKGAGTAPPARQKVKYLTAAEIEAQNEGLEVPNVLKSIIDATGTDVKLLTSTAGLMTSVNGMVATESEEAKLAKRARRELEAFADEWKSLSARGEFFEAQQVEVAKEVVDLEAEIRKLEKMQSIVQKMRDLSMEAHTTDESWERTVTELEAMDTVIDSQPQLSAGNKFIQQVVVAAIHPMFNLAMQDWEPLEDPRRTLGYLERLIHLLVDERASKGTEMATYNENIPKTSKKKSTSPYESLILTLWFPPVRSAIVNDWDPHDASNLLNFIEIWKPVLPSFVLSTLLSRIIPQRLTAAITEWQPSRRSKHKSSKGVEKVPPHTYLFPWFPLLPSYHSSPTSASGLVAELKRKLKSLLPSWTTNSVDIIPNLSIWQPILKGELSSLLTRHLLPRMASFLAGNFLVDPSDQDLSPLTKVLAWTPYLSPTTMAHLLVAELFPKWHQTLHIWLTSEPNYDEIREWFLWWKGQLPAEINAVPAIEAEWNKGLSTITLALDLGPEAVATELPLPNPGPAHSSNEDTVAKDVLANSPSEKIDTAVSTFRDVVEDWAASCDLMVIPLREADPFSGMPMFRLTASATGRGGVVIYLKGDVVWAREGKGDAKSFTPVELNDGLAQRAEGK